MVDALLDFMLGPMRGIGEFYFQHQLIFNPIVIGMAAVKMLFSRNKKHEAEA